MINPNTLLEQLKGILSFLSSKQKPNGEFVSLEHYPLTAPEKGWINIGPSPFIHANILTCLTHCDWPEAERIKQKGCQFLFSLKEGRGFWRFWPHAYPEFKVPFDMDDTCLSSFVLDANKIPVPNKKILAKNKDASGYLNTWIFPHKAFYRFPGVNRRLRRDRLIIQPTLEIGFLHPSDREPAVAANCLLYLGSTPETQPCIQQIIQELQQPEFPQQYYRDPLSVYFHISRAFYHGLKEFKALRPVILDKIRPHLTGKNELNLFQKALLLNIFAHFGALDSATDSFVLTLSKEISELQGNWEPYSYFNSKNNIFQAGTPSLTAAMVFEGILLYWQKIHAQSTQKA